MPQPWRTLIVDDHRMVRYSIGAVVERMGVCRIVAEAGNGREAVHLATTIEELDLVLMDIAMPEMGGPEATTLIKRVRPELKVIALTMFTDQNSIATMIKAGAASYIPKAETQEQLATAVIETMAGRNYFPPGATEALVSLIRTPGLFGGVRFAPREFESLRYAAAGYSVKETASAMKINETTVRGYRKTIGRKIGGSGARALRAFYLLHQSGAVV